MVWSVRRTGRARRPGVGGRQAVLDLFAPFAVTGGGVEQFGMVALDVPPQADLPAVKALLTSGEADGRWTFEEGCIGDAWVAISL